MNIRIIFILLMLACCISVGAQKETKWKQLFNGRNLKGWKAKISGYELGDNFGNTFRVEDKILQTRYNAYDSFRVRFGALYYKKVFLIRSTY